MKRILCLLLALLLVLTLAACSAEELGELLSEAESALQSAEAQTAEAAPTETDAPPQTESPDEPEASVQPEPPAGTDAPTEAPPALDENGVYDQKDDVALYLHLYGHLPANYITKKEAEALGWTGGSLEPYAPGCCIGGSYFGNYEGLLPEAPERSYTECDIDTLGSASRGAKRIVFSNNGLIYYTGDHYESFELLYGGKDE